MAREGTETQSDDNGGEIQRRPLFGPIDQPNLESDHIYPPETRFGGVRYERKKGKKAVSKKRQTACTVF